MLLNKEQSVFLLIDVQEKLTPHVLHPNDLVERCEWLTRLAHEFNVPIIVSEQYPIGLSNTVKPLRDLTAKDPCIEKVHFSCFRESTFIERWEALDRNQVVIAGIETHVCVLQTAMDLNQAGFNVFVVVDAVSSRSEMDQKYGLKRMKQAGIHLVTSEMVFFEWVEKAGTPKFKALSKEYLRKE